MLSAHPLILLSLSVTVNGRVYMHCDHEVFVQAIRHRKKVQVTFFSEGHEGTASRLCGPVFYSPCAAGIDSSCYYLWDFETNADNHFLSLAPSRIVRMELVDESFDLVEFFTCKEQTDGSHCGRGGNSGRAKKEVVDGKNMQEL
jgi:hypothetical protein